MKPNTKNTNINAIHNSSHPKSYYKRAATNGYSVN
jgi:hypothetical protein